MDPFMYLFAYVAAVACAGLGAALVVAPARATHALHEWYIVPPKVRADQRVRLVACRAIGVGLVAGGIALAVSITYTSSRAF